MSGKDWLRLCILSLLWGTSFFFVEVALPAATPFAVSWGRVAFASAAFVLLLLAMRKPLGFVLARWRVYVVMAFFSNALPFSCFAWGQQFINSGLAGILNSTTPLFTIVLVRVMTGKPRRALNWFGVCCGFAGAAVLLLPGGGSENNEGALAGSAVCLVAAASYSFSAYWGSKWLSDYPPAENACGLLTYAAMLLTPFVLFTGFLQPGAVWTAAQTLQPVADSALQLAAQSAAQSAAEVSATEMSAFYPMSMLGILGVGFLGTFCAYLFYFRLLASAGAVNTMLVTFLIPVVSATIGAVFLNEILTPPFFAGASLILLGLAAVDARLFDTARSLLK